MKAILLAAALFSVSAFAYDVTITEPSADRAYQRPAETAQIKVAVKPTPPNYYTLNISVDGKVLSSGAAAYANSVALPSVDYGAGEHIITAQLRNDSGQVVASDTRKIYFIQSNLINRKAKAALADKAAFENLPWYQRLYINLHQESVRESLLPKGQTNQAPMMPTMPTYSVATNNLY